MKKITLSLVFILLAFSMMMCKQKEKEQGFSFDEESELPEVAVPDFCADSAFSFVKAQTDFGPRVPNGDAHRQCANYLISKLKELCDTVYVQSFDAKAYDGKVLKSQNLIGAFNPKAEKRIILAAHWDSRPFADHDPDPANHNKAIDGANDGASGVGVLLEVARQLSCNKPNVGVDIIFFDAEDYGAPEGASEPPGNWWGLGSQYWASHPHVDQYTARYGILLDMVGDPNAHFRYEMHSKMFARDVLVNVWNAAYRLGFGKTFLQSDSHPITDDHYYVNTIAHIPMIDIIHQEDASGTGFPLTWHTLNDNINHIDKNMLAKVGTTLLYVVYHE